jgi:hypothetical protein
LAARAARVFWAAGHLAGGDLVNRRELARWRLSTRGCIQSPINASTQARW